MKVRRKAWTEAVTKAVNKAITDDGGNVQTCLDIIAERLVKLAMEGFMPAIEEIGNRIEGKPHQSVEAVVHNIEEGESFPRSSSYLEWEERHGKSIGAVGTSAGASGKSH